MAELLRIGNNDADRSLYEQWALADDPAQVLADMADAARNGTTASSGFVQAVLLTAPSRTCM